jgi:hypothetical protein
VLEHLQPLWTKIGAEAGRGNLRSHPWNRRPQAEAPAWLADIGSSWIAARFVTGPPSAKSIVTKLGVVLLVRLQIAFLKWNPG